MRRRVSEEECGSERTCIVTGANGAPEAMLRFVLSPEAMVIPDIRRKLPGRGAWTTLSAEAVRRAVQRSAFSRAFRAEAEAQGDLAESVDALLARDALQSLSMANKAGLVVAGAFKVDAAIGGGVVAALIQAADGALDGLAKREQVLRATFGEGAKLIARINVFRSSQLDLALGKANVIHAALKPGAATLAFLARAERLRRYRVNEANAPINSNFDAATIAGAGSWRAESVAKAPSD